MRKIEKRLIGLTGGIATGKTTVSRYLAETYHIPILDADIYAREAVKPGSPILEQIFLKYGPQVQLSDYTLDRQALGEIIFNHPEEKLWLENQIHPFVRVQFETQIQEREDPIIVLAIPLLFEAKMTDLVTEIWVVYCPYEEQIKRLIQRDNLTQEQAINRIYHQFPIEKKMSLADVVLENSLGLNELYHQIDHAFGYSS